MKKMEEFHREKASIDTEIDSIVKDMDSLGVEPKVVEPKGENAGTPVEMMQMSTVARATYTLPEYASTMRLYAKPGTWTSEEIASRSGSGLTVRDLPTEKRSYMTTRSDRALSGKSIVSSALSYRVLSRIATDRDHLSYLVPVVEYTTDTGEKISLSLVRGYR